MRWLSWTLVATLAAACDDGGGSAEQAGERLDAGTDDAGGADRGTDPDTGAADANRADADLADAAPADAEPDLGPAPVDGPGPYAVGFHTETIAYTNPVVGDRPLDLHWWYPTRGEGAVARYAGVFPRQTVGADAPPAGGPWPLVVFSHGNGGLAEQSYFLTEFLASHGFVVVAPDHTGNTFRDSSQPTYRLFELRPQDIGAVLDHADALPADHFLAGRVGPARALAGHSFGGYTALAVGGAGYAVDALVGACAEPPEAETPACEYLLDPATAARYGAGFEQDRLQAIIPLTPAGANLFGGDPGLAGVDVPTLMMTAALDATLPNPAEGDPLWDGLVQPDSLRLDFLRAGHFTFSNACTLAPGSMGDGCGAGFLPADEAHRLINAYALAFLRLHLLGDAADADLLDGTRRLEMGEIELSRVE